MTARKLTMLGAAGAVALLLGLGAAAAQGPGHGPGPGPGGREFFGGPGLGGKVVTGYPFSAQAVSTFSNTLSGGNSISRTECAIIARDSNGDTYEAVTPKATTCTSSTAAMITITNVAAGERYFINVAKGTYSEMKLRTPPAGSHQPPPRNASQNEQKTDLGSSTIANVTADGTQIVRTIPAGQIGNAQAITNTSITWFSQTLQAVVQSSHVDPARGTSNYQLSNIQAGEPLASLFTLPSGLTLIQHGPRGGFQHP